MVGQERYARLRKRGRSTLATTAMLLLAAAAGRASRAATYIIPPDEVMIRQADLIVRGSVLSVESLRDSRGGIVTDATIAVEKVLRGSHSGSILTVRHPGGELDGEIESYPGTGTFAVGERVLLILTDGPGSPPRLLNFALGKFRIVAEPGGEEIVLRDGLVGARVLQGLGPRFTERPRRLAAFEDAIERLSLGLETQGSYFIEEEAARTIMTAAPFELFNPPCIWQQFATGDTIIYKDDSVGMVGNSCPSGCHAEVGTGVETWNGAPGTLISLQYGGTDPAVGVTCLPQLMNQINYDDPCGEIPDLFACSGTLALGGFWSFSQPVVHGCPQRGGLDLRRIYSGRVLFNNGVGDCLNPCDITDTATHEVGHSIGLDHSLVSTAVMAPTLVHGRCGALTADDIDGAVCLYASAVPPQLICDATAAPLSPEVGEPIQFGVTVSGGTQPLTFAWDLGDGTTSSSKNPPHAFAAAGPYHAMVTVTDSGATDAPQVCQDSVDVTVTPCVPRTISTVTAKEKTQTSVKVVVTGAGFTKTDKVQIDAGSGFVDAPVTKFKTSKKLVGAKVAGIFPDGGVQVQVRVIRATGCASSSLPASR